MIEVNWFAHTQPAPDCRRRPFSRLADAVLLVAGTALLGSAALVDLDPRHQAILAVTTCAVFLLVNRVKSRTASVFLVMLSLAVSLRYIVWRMTETLGFSAIPELALGYGLVLAESYAIVVLVLGYVQTIWPLERKPVPLPDDPLTWPAVDVFIPTYNEPMSVVRATVLGALAIDWPPGKLRVYLLDDGRRPEFAAFAQSCGAAYVTRPDNRHAKAGNLNNGLSQTGGAFVAVFDCDHVPTRAFLQMTMGWMVAEPRNALVQTPHHFYSPDPFQRNLAAGTRVPSEGNMFYGLVQDSNDFWNAAFFCGSCAVLRRSALDEIGGFAVETVTEDAHTMLKLHRRGWHSAYLRLPLAAGLATERLSRHIGQRMRWARGMIQIFRTDNPLLGRGLTLGQRVCYLQAMVHFLFAIPRIVFLMAPLAFLLLGQNVIAASPLAIVSYALPHIFHSVATSSRLQRHNRHSFWSEIYETVLALFLVRVTVATLLRPRRGAFNVTSKGGQLENGYFDLAAVYPNLVLALLLGAGVVRGVVGMTCFDTDQLTFQALLLNSIWGGFSLLTVLAALAVGRETPQLRARARVPAAVPVSIRLPDGRMVGGVTRDLSQGGALIAAARPHNTSAGTAFDLAFDIGGETFIIPSRVVRWEERALQVCFQPQTVADEAAIVQAVFGRADAWTGWAAYPVDRPLVSLYRVLLSIGGLFRSRNQPPPAIAGMPVPDPGRVRRRTVAGATAAALLALLPAGARAQVPASAPAGSMDRQAPSSGFVIRPVPIAVPHIQQAQARLGILNLPPAALPSWPTPVSSVAPEPAPATSPPDPPQTRRLVLTLHQLGALAPLTLRGTSELQGVQFGIRSDEVVTQALLTLSGATSPALIPEFSNITVTLNEQYVGTIPAVRDRPRFEGFELPLSPVFFQDDNRLNFRFSGRYTTECNDPLSGLLWSTISDASTVTLTLERLPAQRDLDRLPLPFFDAHDKQKLNLPFVVPQGAANETLQAAGIVASWFGQQADFRGATFPVSTDAPGDGDAIVFVNGQDRPGNVNLPPIAGPTLAVLPNPTDSHGSLLLVAGRDAGEIVVAAQALTLGARSLVGQVATVTAPDLPERRPYDAPAWIATDRPVKLGELVDASALQGTGFVPGTMRVPFRTAPDLYTWRNRPFPVDVRFRAPPGPIADLAVSRLDVGINNLYLASVPLAEAPTRAASWWWRATDFLPRPGARIYVPAYDVFGQNDLQFFFDTRPLHRGDCAAIPQDLHMSVDPDSTVDLSRAYRFAEMPNLAFFVNSGFPFTRMADLSETAIVLPDRTSAGEMEAFLDLMGRFGAITGSPAVKVSVARPGGVPDIGDRDVLLMGATARLGGALALLNGSPYRVDGNRLHIELASTLGGVRRLFSDPARADRDRAAAKFATGMGGGTAALVGAQNPLQPGRSVVAMLGGSPLAVEALVTALADTEQAPLIQGDLSLVSAGVVTSYRVGDTFTVGHLPPWLYPSWLFRDQPFAIVAMMMAGCGVLASVWFWVLQRRAAQRAGTRPYRREPG